ncbi:MAG: DNA topoisomerase IV, partial [Thiovulaceae bacterium]|nr:DNA topoisomerase IV [Sulfurimonadaceae bacterium]
MKILLLNDNPVVNKLVTLSAQKTSDELDVATNIDEVNTGSYDLVVVDDTVFKHELMQELKSKIIYDKSLYICSKDAEFEEGFTSTLKKPFLPTDLVEIFSHFGRDVESDDMDTPINDEIDEEETDDMDNINLDDKEDDLEDEGEELNLDDL